MTTPVVRGDRSTLPTDAEGRPSPLGYEPGDVVAGKYRLTSVLGEGGMGSVWLARNQTLHVDVALKLIRADVASAHTADRLLREARATARLKHSSIVRVHDFGESERGDPFIVMEVLEGEQLSEVLERKGAFPATRAVQLLLPIVSALVEAHENGVVHRDIKPENIILVADRQGTIVPKVLDFGIAKMGRSQAISGEIPNDPESLAAHELKRKLTNMGTLVGSPDYMSPEQARGDTAVDERADIWSLCVVLYEMICDRRPFDGAEVEEVLLHILIDDAKPFTLYGADDAELWQVVSKGLEKNRDDRWPSARAFGEALAQWLLARGVETDVTGSAVRAHWFSDEEAAATGRASWSSLHLDPPSVDSLSLSGVSTPESPPGQRRLRWALLGAIGVLVLAIGVGIGLLSTSSEPPARPAAEAVAPVEPERGSTEASNREPDPKGEPAEVVNLDTPDEPTAERAGDGGHPAAMATATATAAPRPRPWPTRPRPMPKTGSGSEGLPLPAKPDF